MFVFQLQRARRGGQIRSLDSESATKSWQLQCLERKTIDISKSFQPKGRIPRKSVQSTNTFSEGGPKDRPQRVLIEKSMKALRTRSTA